MATTTTTTTQILFNSPALHSLKRDQLVKLCKIHSIKANGKNSELIERLKQRAAELPPEEAAADEEEDPLADQEDDDHASMDVDVDGIPGGMPVHPAPVLAPSESDNTDGDVSMNMNAGNSNSNSNLYRDRDGNEMESDDCEMQEMQDVVLTSRFSIPRPSEQWEVVMEDIAEVDETMGTASSKGSLRTVSGGEFGTHSSKASVTSSIRALATSLGIKRATSKSSHHRSDFDFDAEGSKMPSFSPGKLFSGSSRARDSLAEHATPYAQIPPSDSLPETDHFKFATPDASILEDVNDGEDDDDDGVGVPKSPRPAPRTSILFGSAVKSTIRLVSHPAAPKTSGDAAYMSPPRLPIVQTDFDITVGTPGTVRTLSMWPASPYAASGGETGSLYPRLPLEDLKPSSRKEDDDDEYMPGGIGMPTTTPAKTSLKGKAVATSTSTAKTTTTSTPGPIDEPDMFSPAKPRAAPAPAPSGAAATPAASASRSTLPRSTPFLFGSPLPRRGTPAAASKDKDGKDSDNNTAAGVSNAAFDGVAKSILEEMHRRLAEANAQKGEGAPKPSSSLQTGTGTGTESIFSGLNLGAHAQTQTQTKDRFAKVHDAEFSKMDSITHHYAARRPNKRKSDALGHGSRPVAGQKRRSSAQGARVISAGTRKKMAVPGGFGGDDDDEDEEGEEGGGAGRDEREDEDEDDAGARRSSKRIRITEGWDVHRGQRVSIAPPLPPAQEEKKQKEHEAAKRELNAAKARRRSSRGRPSMGAPPAKGKASRFGFLGAAKSLVRNVWNMGGGSKTKPAGTNAPPSSIPVPKASTQPPAPATNGSVDKKSEKAKADAAAATNTRKASGPTNKLLKPPPKASTSTSGAKAAGTVTSTKSTSSRARSPIPPFTAPSASSGTVKSTASRPSNATGTARSRVSSTSTTTGTAASRQTGRTSTVSSMGTRTSSAGTSTAVSSIGTRRSFASTNTLASTSSSKGEGKSLESSLPTLRKRPSSLYAPTASSLAKTNAAARPSASGRTSGLPAVAEAQKPKRASITQAASSSKATIAAATSPLSPRPTRIFSQPLTNFSSPAQSSSAATPVHHPSLTAAASSIMGTTDAASSPSKIPRPAVIPPKPKQLVVRKPRVSRSRVIAKLGAQRAAAAQGSSLSPGGGRTRSSVGARRSFGGVKSGRASGGSEVMRSAMIKKRARQSEYMRRRSRPASENEPVGSDD
ncbi:hypothetical protein L226DRAFT_612224 [Lentinus tigrinus ALCF2SS1-7]|uniref:SAP domain-containing protein n=1 Tax=Lentinus tigrinus ALCF2SS1-6 TaxID=1328759 RepID=A0A5C2SDK9_9APHY|nr:hypothetical protein L227DRAFT_652506 [Lentinus tigrinus ALCF2SS1-6]RPD75960.1 hypothetical protein L226DRAFT_612224 [Lentinus tigrinus ALCF2SS1-7]